MRRAVLAALAALAALILAHPARADSPTESIFFFKPSASVSVGTSATALASDANHSFVEVCNADASKTLSVSFSASVTTANGRPVPPGQCIQFTQLLKSQTLYGVTTSGTLSAIVTEALPSGR